MECHTIWHLSGSSLLLVHKKVSATDDNFKFCHFFKNNKKGMIFHENRLLADDSHEISLLIFGKMLQNLSSAAVAIGALRVNNEITLLG